MEMKQKSQYTGQSLLLFDPIIVLRDLMQKWFLILVIAVFLAVTAFVVADQIYVPVYESNATLVVTTHTSFTSVYDNISSASSLATVFSDILNSSVLRKRILEQQSLMGFTGTITSSVLKSTNLLSVRVQADDPRTAFLVIQAIIENHDIVTYDVVGNISVEVLQYPVVPTAPVNRNNAWDVMRSVLIISIAGLCVLMAFLSISSNRVRSRAEAERKLDCWCLGEIFHENKTKSFRELFSRKKKSILITRPETGFQYVSTIGRLCRRIEQHMHRGRVLMVTSVMENEGKSTVAVNLALEMARKRDKVLLIDCDLYKPACRKMLGLSLSDCCINDVLEGRARLGDAVVTDRLSGLHLLGAKKVTDGSSGDLIASAALRGMLRLAREEYDFVLIDLPPMCVATDSEYVAEYADASLLVVRQNEVDADAVNRAISVLEEGRARLLGCVLNNVYTSFRSAAEGYAYGRENRGYGHYGEYGRYNTRGSNKSGR